MDDKLSKINKECTEKGRSYADWQKQMYPIQTGLNKNKHSSPIDDSGLNTIKDKKENIHMLIHPQFEKTHPKVSLTRNAIALINK